MDLSVVGINTELQLYNTLQGSHRSLKVYQYFQYFKAYKVEETR